MSTLIADFSGKDLEVRWTANANSASDPDLTMKEFVCDFVVNDIVVRTKTIPYKADKKCLYLFDEMVKDQGTAAPNRTVSVRLRERDMFIRESASALGTFTNPIPDAVSFTAQPFLVPAGSASGTVLVKITPVTDEDLLGYQIFRGSSAGFTPSTGNRIYMGGDTAFFDETVVPGTTYFYKAAAFDKFSSTVASLNFAAAVSAAGNFALDVVDITFKDLVFVPNADGVTNRLRWGSGTAFRQVEGANTVTSKTISGSFIESGTTERYVYFDWESGLMKSNTSIVNALSKPDNRILATYKGDTNLIEGINQPIMDGSKILAHTIGASQIVTTNAVITGTAQIANAVIGTAHIANVAITTALIANAAITTAKVGSLDANTIKTGYLSAGRIEGGSITTAKLDAGNINASVLKAGTVKTTHLEAGNINASVIKAGTIKGTHIDTDTITAKNLIKTASIITHNAQLGDATVDTLTIKKGTLGYFYEKDYRSIFNLPRGIERILVSFAIPPNVEGKIAIIGCWTWEADDDPDVKYRILRTRGSTTKELGMFLADKGHGDVAVNFTMSAGDDVLPGDIIRLALTRVAGDDVTHLFTNLMIFGVLR